MPLLMQRVGKERLYTRGGREPHRRLVLERGDPRAGEPGRAARVRLRAAGERSRGLALLGDRRGAAEARAGRLDARSRCRSTRPRCREEAVERRARGAAAHRRRARAGRGPAGAGRRHGRRRPDRRRRLGSARLRRRARLRAARRGDRERRSAGSSPARTARSPTSSRTDHAAARRSPSRSSRSACCRRSTTSSRRPRPSSTRSTSCAPISKVACAAQIDDELEGLLPRRRSRRARQARSNVHAGRPARRGAHARAAERARPQPAGSAASTPNSYLQLTGQSPEALEQRLRAEATMSVARELVLEAVADKLGIQVDRRRDPRGAAQRRRDRRGHRRVRRRKAAPTASATTFD